MTKRFGEAKLEHPARGPMKAKQWFQILGASLMVAAVTGGRTGVFWHPKTFLAGALIFSSTFIKWKRSANDDDSATDEPA
jgi:hypothetical protein